MPVCAGIDREYDEKVKFWPTVYGKENVPASPTKPTPFHHSLFVLEGNEQSPVILLGPLQGDSVDHTLFWLPSEKTIICGDAVYARSTHVWSVHCKHHNRLQEILTCLAQGRRDRNQSHPGSLVQNPRPNRCITTHKNHPRPSRSRLGTRRQSRPRAQPQVSRTLCREDHVCEEQARRGRAVSNVQGRVS